MRGGGWCVESAGAAGTGNGGRESVALELARWMLAGRTVSRTYGRGRTGTRRGRGRAAQSSQGESNRAGSGRGVLFAVCVSSLTFPVAVQGPAKSKARAYRASNCPMQRVCGLSCVGAGQACGMHVECGSCNYLGVGVVSVVDEQGHACMCEESDASPGLWSTRVATSLSLSTRIERCGYRRQGQDKDGWIEGLIVGPGYQNGSARACVIHAPPERRRGIPRQGRDEAAVNGCSVLSGRESEEGFRLVALQSSPALSSSTAIKGTPMPDI
jgi:hypothetical protein